MRSKILAGVALAAALAFPSVAPADEIARDTSALAVVSAVDLVTTRHNISLGAHEDNSFAKPFVKSNGSALVYFAANMLLTDLIGHALYRHSKNAARAYMGATIGGEVFADLHNFSTLRGLPK